MPLKYTRVKLKTYGNYYCTVNFLGNTLSLYFNFNSRLNKRFVSVWLYNTCILEDSILESTKSYKLNYNAIINGINAELRFEEITETIELWDSNLLYFIQTDDTVGLEKVVYDGDLSDPVDNDFEG